MSAPNPNCPGCVALLAQIAALAAQVTQLQAQVTQLQARLNQNSRNSSSHQPSVMIITGAAEGKSGRLTR